MTDDPQARLSQLLRAQGALDGEFDAANALAFEQELARDGELQRIQASGEALRRTLRAHVRKEPAPEALRAKILALGTPTAAPNRFWRPENRWLPLAAAVAAMAFLAGYFFGGRNSYSPDEAAQRALVDSYARAEISGQPFDVASSDRHTVKPWLASRLTLGAEVVDLADSGFPLAGGRIDIVDQAPVATLVYRRREHWISVSELPVSKGAAPTKIGASTLSGFRVRQWSDASRAYVAVSDIDPGELDTFVDAFRRKADSEPPGSEPR